MGLICEKSCQTYQFGRIFVRFSRVETNLSGKNREKMFNYCLCWFYFYFIFCHSFALIETIWDAECFMASQIKNNISRSTYSVIRESKFPIHSRRSSSLYEPYSSKSKKKIMIYLHLLYKYCQNYPKRWWIHIYFFSQPLKQPRKKIIHSST